MTSHKHRRAGTAVALAVATAAASRYGLHRAVERSKARSDPDLDPLYDLPGDVSEHDIDAPDGGTVHLVERGSGRPLLLIHGVTLQAGIWAPQMHMLADRYRVLAMDVRGHGRSRAGTDGLGRKAAARDVAAVLSHLDLHDVVIVGHSMGGMILMEFAGDFPEELSRRVAGLVFMNTAAHQLLPRGVLPVAQATGRRVRRRFEAGRPVPQRPIGEDDLSWMMARTAFGARPSGRAVEQLRSYMEQVPQSTSVPSWIDIFDHDARDALRATRTPSLILVGSRDLLTPVYAARRIASFLPGSRLEVLAGAGHQLMQERPAELARLIDEFSSALPAGGRPDADRPSGGATTAVEAASADEVARG